MRAGLQVGVGEGRPDSRRSAGLGYGQFDVDDYEELPPPKSTRLKPAKRRAA